MAKRINTLIFKKELIPDHRRLIGVLNWAIAVFMPASYRMQYRYFRPRRIQLSPIATGAGLEDVIQVVLAMISQSCWGQPEQYHRHAIQ